MHTIVSKKELPKSQIELSVSIPYSEVEAARAEAIRDIKETVDIDGFRRGTAPDKMIIDRVGEETVLERAARIVLNKEFPLALEAEKIDVISAPDVRVTKLAAGNPFEFTATVAVMPKIVLPDYTAIGASIATVDEAKHVVDDAELGKFVDSIRTERAKVAKRAVLENAGEKVENVEVTDTDLPALDDDFVKTLGQFESVDDFMTKVREHLTEEKILKAKQARRAEILEALAAAVTVEVPDILVEQELDRVLLSFEGRIKQMGVNLETYYKEIGKTADELRTEWRPDAEKRAKINLVLPEIATKESIMPDMNIVNREAEHIMTQIKGADIARTRLYVYASMMNELVLEYLETGVKPVAQKSEATDAGHVHDENCNH
jgi:FKBP-type peptidyl-prolyl cis-trans isomerase (trigger factor)